MTETRVTINTWLTKASLRNCKAYLDQLNVPTLERTLEALLKVKETKKAPEWRHYCGEKPRYWYISARGDGAIVFDGGTVWHAEIKDGTLYTDGCTTRGLLVDVIDEALKQVRMLAPRCNAG
jgi:IS4 transposase